MIIDLKDVIDTLRQMRDDVVELYNCETIYSLSLDVAINTLRGNPTQDKYYGNIY